ncbi:MAG TPA: HD domain-containing protein [Firmicutes bacterium]|jgi:predicted HD superfamily hydrolase involved in NAD metabolism|nr:HD domain-containing protein [Bacillota bacterium]
MEWKFYHRMMRNHLGAELYQHSLGVAETAADLALRYRGDRLRAYLAGLLHDYGKVYSSSELRSKAEQMGLRLDRVSLEEKGLLHAPVGAALLPIEVGVTDSAVLKAVAYHTTGRPGASLMEKVLYLADIIEPGRDFEGVEGLREIARTDLERALLAAVEHTIQRVLQRGFMLHPRSVRFRNSLLAGLRKNGG